MLFHVRGRFLFLWDLFWQTFKNIHVYQHQHPQSELEDPAPVSNCICTGSDDDDDDDDLGAIEIRGVQLLWG